MMKTILITGSTDGIGKLTAIKLAKEGHIVYLHGRNADKLKEVTKEVKAASANENIYGFVADFTNLNAVVAMADEVKSKLSVLDVLINNAGIFKAEAEITAEGFDIRFAVNYFAPFIFTNALLPLLKNSTNSRIINLSSAAQAPVSLEALEGKSKLSAQTAYAQSKLAITMWSFHLAENLKSSIVIAVNPGSLLNTKMVKEAYGQHWSEADKGVDILFEFAVAEKHDNNSGKYFDNDKGAFGLAHPDAYDKNNIYKLMSFTDTLVNKLLNI